MRMILENRRKGLQAWAQFDDTASVWEIFASDTGEDYIGCADSIPEARAVASAWFAEFESR